MDDQQSLKDIRKIIATTRCYPPRSNSSINTFDNRVDQEVQNGGVGRKHCKGSLLNKPIEYLSCLFMLICMGQISSSSAIEHITQPGLQPDLELPGVKHDNIELRKVLHNKDDVDDTTYKTSILSHRQDRKLQVQQILFPLTPTGEPTTTEPPPESIAEFIVEPTAEPTAKPTAFDVTTLPPTVTFLDDSITQGLSYAAPTTPSPSSIKIVSGVEFSSAPTFVQFGTESPTPIQTSGASSSLSLTTTLISTLADSSITTTSSTDFPIPSNPPSMLSSSSGSALSTPSDPPSMLSSSSGSGLSTPSDPPSMISSSSESRLSTPSEPPSSSEILSEFESSGFPTILSSDSPSLLPTLLPSLASNNPSITPSFIPSHASELPSEFPSDFPSLLPSSSPSLLPSSFPSLLPSLLPSVLPSPMPSNQASETPSDYPSFIPSTLPSFIPTKNPTTTPSLGPTISSVPTFTRHPTTSPTISAAPSESTFPTLFPTESPSSSPSLLPSSLPSLLPSQEPSIAISQKPSLVPSESSPLTSGPTNGQSEQVLSDSVTSVSTQAPTATSSQAPSVVQKAIFQQLSVEGVQMVLRGVGNLDRRSSELWAGVTADHIMQEILNDGVEAVTVDVRILSTSPVNRRRNSLLRRQLQETETDLSGFRIDFDVDINLLSSVLDRTASDIVEAAFKPDQKNAQYIANLKNSGDPAFANIESAEVTVPTPVSAIQQEAPRKSPISTGLIIGLAVAMGVVMLLIVLLSVQWVRKRRLARDMDSSENSASHRELEVHIAANDAEINVGPKSDISTLGDPLASVRGDHAGTGTNNEPPTPDDANLYYDYNQEAQVEETNVSVPIDDAALDAHYASRDQFVRFEILAPPGVLGVVLEADEHGVPVVHSIKDASPLVDQVCVGDKLVMVDGQDSAGMMAYEVTRLIASRADRSRRLVFSRAVDSSNL